MRPDPLWRERIKRKVGEATRNPPKVFTGRGKGTWKKPTWMLIVLAWFHEEWSQLLLEDPTCAESAVYHAGMARSVRRALKDRRNTP